MSDGIVMKKKGYVQSKNGLLVRRKFKASSGVNFVEVNASKLKDVISVGDLIFKRVDIEEIQRKTYKERTVATFSWRIDENGVVVTDFSRAFVGKLVYTEDANSKEKATHVRRPGVIIPSASCYPYSMSRTYSFKEERLSERLVSKDGDDIESTIGAVFYRIFIPENMVNVRGVYILASDLNESEDENDYSKYYAKTEEVAAG